jgi:hypothetical protein
VGVGTMRDQKLKLRDLCDSHTRDGLFLGECYEEIKRELINRIFIIYDGLCYERRVFGKFIYAIKKTKTEGRRCRTKTMMNTKTDKAKT